MKVLEITLLVFVFTFIGFSRQGSVKPPKSIHRTSYQEDNTQKVYIRGVQCNASEKYIHKNFSCFAKSYNRTFSTVNVIGITKKPLNSILIEVKLFYKYGTIYREVMHTPVFNWCLIFKEGTTNKMIQQVIQLVQDIAPSAIHACPYVDLNLRNCNIKTATLMSVFPSGDYKFMIFVSNESGESIAVLNAIVNMQSSNKDTFG